MSVVVIQQLLEVRLAAITPALETAWENTEFKPTANPYQRVEHLRGTPETPERGSGFRRELGIMQVTLMYPMNKGAGLATARAEVVRAQFPKNLRLSSGGINLDFETSPYIMAGFRDEDRWALPIRISYFSNISS